jgi:hypothetical protein
MVCTTSETAHALQLQPASQRHLLPLAIQPLASALAACNRIAIFKRSARVLAATIHSIKTEQLSVHAAPLDLIKVEEN